MTRTRPAVPRRLRPRQAPFGSLAVVLAIGLALAACAGGPPQVVSEVTRFTTLDPSPAAALSGQPVVPAAAAHKMAPRRFTIVPQDRTAAPSLEFDAYAGELARLLAAYGHAAVQAGAAADWIVALGYAVDGGSEAIEAVPDFDWVYNTVVDRNGYVHLVPRFAYVGNRYFASMRFTRTVTVKITEAKGSDGNADRPVFEATARSLGGAATLAPVMAPMLRAMMHAFPGRNGETFTLGVPVAVAVEAGSAVPGAEPSADDATSNGPKP